jgi:2-oxoisovalerate dehydrogenase E1 component
VDRPRGGAKAPATVNIFDRVTLVDANFRRLLSEWDRPLPPRADPSAPVREGSPLTGLALLELFESQMTSRHLDFVSRVLRERDQSFYTIGSAGHEGNAVLGRLTRPTDPAFLHYRSGALMAERSRHMPEVNFIYDTLLSQTASAEDPVSHGRHKVWGSAPMWVLPQTSTIASHLPKALGMAIGIRRARKMGIKNAIPDDSIVVCSFGDASVNHSTAMGAFSAAARAAYQQVGAPILFVCEDNGLGISAKTPEGWIEGRFKPYPGLSYYAANGLDLVETDRVVREAVNACRVRCRPVFLHLKVVRLLGHAGSDVELTYRSQREVEQTEADDPLLHTARIVLETGLLRGDEILERYNDVRRRVDELAERAVKTPRLTSVEEIVEHLAPYSENEVEAEATQSLDAEERETFWGGASKLPEAGPPRHLSAMINLGLHDLMAKYPNSLLFGEDVAVKGGVYHVTHDLWKRFGHARVFNTVLDEQMILGLAQGLGYCGLLPFPEIQYLAYFHNACDQIRGEACSTQFFSAGKFRNPMVLRIAALGYQKGFGGHFHNDNSIAALRDIPGLVIACPSRGDDAVGMLRTATAMAHIDGRVVAYLEPIALYGTKDLYEEKDGGWCFPYPAPGEAVPFGSGRAYGEESTDLAIVTYGNGVRLSLRAARTLEREHGIRARVLDLRWLNPLPAKWIGKHAEACDRVLIVDEGRRTGGVGEALITAVVEHSGSVKPMRRVTGADSYIPLGPAADHVLPSEAGIVADALELCRS